MIRCPECGKEISYVAIYRHDACGRNSLIAMGLCIVGALLFVISGSFLDFVQYENFLSMPQKEYAMWCVENNTELIVFNLIGAMSAICVGLAFLMWLMRDRSGKNTPLVIGAVICIVMLLVKSLWLIPKPVWWAVYNESVSDIMSYRVLVAGLLSMALVVTFFFMKGKGKIKGLTITVGVLLVISYLISCLYGVFDIAHMEHPFMDTIVFRFWNEVIYLGSLVVAIILFFSTYKQSSHPDCPEC